MIVKTTLNMLTVVFTPLLILEVKKAKMNNHEKLFRLIILKWTGL